MKGIATVGSFLLAAALLVSCTPPQTAPIPALGPTQVDASFGKTWNAVVDVLADKNIPVKTMDKSSGFVTAESTHVPNSQLSKLTECGGFASYMAETLGSESGGTARYNILVRGDSTSSTVKVTARFTKALADNSPMECKTKGIFEQQIESAVKAHAEGRATGT